MALPHDAETDLQGCVHRYRLELFVVQEARNEPAPASYSGRRDEYVFHYSPPRGDAPGVQAANTIPLLLGVYQQPRQATAYAGVVYEALRPEHLGEAMRVVQVPDTAMLVGQYEPFKFWNLGPLLV